MIARIEYYRYTSRVQSPQGRHTHRFAPPFELFFCLSVIFQIFLCIFCIEQKFFNCSVIIRSITFSDVDSCSGRCVPFSLMLRSPQTQAEVSLQRCSVHPTDPGCPPVTLSIMPVAVLNSSPAGDSFALSCSHLCICVSRVIKRFSNAFKMLHRSSLAYSERATLLHECEGESLVMMPFMLRQLNAHLSIRASCFLHLPFTLRHHGSLLRRSQAEDASVAFSRTEVTSSIWDRGSGGVFE